MPSSCFMVQETPIGGGNILTDPLISVRRSLAIGDTVASLCVADALISKGFKVEFQSHPEMHCVLRRHGRLNRIAPPRGHAIVNLDGAYENHPNRKTRHFSDLFFDSANRQLEKMGINLGKPLNCTPRLTTSANSKAASVAKFQHFPKPWVFICPRSQAFYARTIPDPIWMEAAKHIEGTKFWIGMHPAPPGIVDLQVKHFDLVMDWLSVADLLITVDTGPLHVAAAMGIPILAIGQSSSPELHLSDQRDYQVCWPDGLTCLNCQENACPINYELPPCQKIDPMKIAVAANKRLRSIFSEDISAVIAVYRPDVNTLNRCLESVLPQVNEIVVAAEANSLIPAAALKHEKIKYVRSQKRDVGYSGNANYGSRHTNGKYLLMINDDVVLNPGSVALMKECMDNGVGIVTNLLYYPNGKIYYNGKFRTPGQRGWGHGDYGLPQPTRTEPLELENACGCVSMVRRKAFYDVLCFDEADALKIYASDDDMALKVRRAGYRIMHNPRSTGIHIEAQSTKKLADINGILGDANHAFSERWSRYLDHNAHKTPIGDFNYQ